jgi:hypothetical protein
MPHRRFAPRLPSYLRLLGCWLWSAIALLPANSNAEEVGSAVYVRTDSDHTTVVSPRLRVRTPIADATHLDLTYAVDVWTSASIDIVAAASRVVTEQRDEIDVSFDHEFSDVLLEGGYRYSHEPDYVSHSGNASVSFDMADRNSTLALGTSLSSDTVGRAGDPTFSRAAQTFGLRASFTQIIDRRTLVQALYDLSYVHGYQGSPYRFVAVGGDGICGGFAPFCLPEREPNRRVRHALALRGRRALGARWSAGAGYRLYLDSWNLLSHTLSVDLTWLPGDASSVTLGYRAYTQSAADHYRSHYTIDQLTAPNFMFTNDKELSPLSSQRVMLDLDHEFTVSGSKLRTTLSLGPTFYAYRDFLPLRSMLALDVTGAAALEF